MIETGKKWEEKKKREKNEDIIAKRMNDFVVMCKSDELLFLTTMLN